MRKLLSATVLASLVAGAAFASSMPVLDIEQGQTGMNLEYIHHAVINDSDVNENGMAISAEYGLRDNIAVQIAHSRIQYDGPDFKTNELVGVYRVNDKINAFVGGMRVTGDDNTENMLQAGVIGHMFVAPGIEAFTKLGIGTSELGHVFQLGAKYQINNNLDAHAYYEHNKFEKDDDKMGVRGYYVGVGYKF